VWSTQGRPSPLRPVGSACKAPFLAITSRIALVLRRLRRSETVPKNKKQITPTALSVEAISHALPRVRGTYGELHRPCSSNYATISRVCQRPAWRRLRTNVMPQNSWLPNVGVMTQNGCYPQSVFVVLVSLAAAACVRVVVWPARYSWVTPLLLVCEFPERLEACLEVGTQLARGELMILGGERVAARWGEDPAGEQAPVGCLRKTVIRVRDGRQVRAVDARDEARADVNASCKQK